MKLKTRLVIAFFTIIIIPVLMAAMMVSMVWPLSDRSGGEELWDYRNDDF